MTCRLSRLWRDHGTKIAGWLVAILGALTAFADRITELFFDDRGAAIFRLAVDIASYLIIGAGAIIIRRGYTNSRREGEEAWRPGDDPL